MAVINIGSGSVKLYLQSTKEIKAAVTLLALGDKKEEAVSETFNAVAAFCLEAEKHGEKITIFGTEAMRRDGKLAGLIRDRLGYATDIIDGKTEALCGFLGCGGQENKTVIDVGGASTEISNGKLKPDLKISLKIGSVALYSLFAKEEQHTFGSENDNRNFFFDRLFAYIDGFLDFSPPAKKGKVYLIGGGALCLAGIINNMIIESTTNSWKFDPQALSGAKLKPDGILIALKSIFGMDLKQRVFAYPFIEEKRALVLPYGIGIIYRVLKKLSINTASVSASGLIEGYIKLKNL